MVLQTSQQKLHLRGELKLVHLQETILLEFYFNYWFFAVSFNPEMNMSKKLKKKPQQNINNNKTPKNQTKLNQNINKNVGVLQGELLALLLCSEERRKIISDPCYVCLWYQSGTKVVGSVFLVGWFVLVLIAVIPALKGQHALWNMYLIAHN